MEQGANLRSLVHWANGVYEDKLLDMDSLIKRELQSRVISHGTICKLKLDGMGSRNERKLRIFHYANRGKVNEYHLEAINNF